MSIVIDKSFLRGAPGHQLASLLDSHRCLMPDVLFYEMFKDDERRHKLFGRLGGRTSPMLLLPGTGELLRYEIEHRKCVGLLEHHALVGDYRFNPKLAEEGLSLERWMHDATVSHGSDYRASARSIADLIGDVPKLIPVLAGYRAGQGGWEGRFRMAYDTVGQHDNAVRALYAQLRHPDWPRPNLVRRPWALFRKVQLDCLFIVSIFQRYCPKPPENSIEKTIEHDMRDRDYALFGLLAGALATNDLHLTRIVRAAEPSVVVISTSSHDHNAPRLPMSDSITSWA